jgi:hypothetical protein
MNDPFKSRDGKKNVLFIAIFLIGLGSVFYYFKKDTAPTDIKVVRKASNRLTELRQQLEDSYAQADGKLTEEWLSFGRQFKPILNQTMASSAKQLQYDGDSSKNHEGSVAYSVTSYAGMLSLLHSVMNETLKEGAKGVNLDDIRKKLDLHEEALRESKILEEPAQSSSPGESTQSPSPPK